jgi:hypothetical protein
MPKRKATIPVVAASVEPVVTKISKLQLTHPIHLRDQVLSTIHHGPSTSSMNPNGGFSMTLHPDGVLVIDPTNDARILIPFSNIIGAELE